jgi:hypothetical protein
MRRDQRRLTSSAHSPACVLILVDCRGQEDAQNGLIGVGQ